MTVTFLADEHVPSVFSNTLRSNDYVVETARDVVGEGTPDTELLEYAGENSLVLITHDRRISGEN